MAKCNNTKCTNDTKLMKINEKVIYILET